MSDRSTRRMACAIVVLLLSAEFALAQYERPLTDTPEALAAQSMEWRSVGPANMGGRVTDIDGIPGDPTTYYVSGAEGGVLKTTDGGVSFEQLFDDQRAFSVGALAIAPSDHQVLWLGSGEGDPRNSVGYGNGVYRSTDGGQSWTHLGLDDSERIKRIMVHPDNPDVAMVCALGHEWGANEMRGVFRTTDGGANWEKVLYIDEDTGCSDLDMEEGNPRIMYAGMWTFRRKPWRFDDGGKETALYRTMDGGMTWKKLSKCLPTGPMARIGVSVAQSQPSTVYLISEAAEGGILWRSDNRGDSWTLINEDANINFRPFYYSDVLVDPNNPDHVYTLAGGLFKSTDGGKNFDRIGRTVHGDHQSFWIDPENSNRILSGSDGGWQVSWDAGASFDIVNNVPLSQFYQLYVDGRKPYYVCGGLQDNGTWCAPSNSLHTGGIMKKDWHRLAGGDGYFAIPIPGSEHEAYANLQGGVIFHVDTKTGNVRNIHPYPAVTGSAGAAIEDHKYRFNWDSPIHISPHDPNTVYFGGNVVFKSTDRGHSWTEISPDLTTNDKSKQATSGGEIYQDNTAAEFHCTILYIEESPIEPGVIWVGTDDGRLHITRDGGESWTDLTDRVRTMPEFAWIGKIDASPHNAGTAYLAIDQHRMDDFRPHAFKTTDYGATWTRITTGLPEDDYIKVVREDPIVQDVLYVGMQHGIYMSWDGGTSWSSIQNGLPPASVRDLQIQPQEHDLVIGTHGRGAFIMDDISALARLPEAMDKEAHLFDVRDPVRWQYWNKNANTGDRQYAAENPDPGAYINFFAKEDPGEVTVEIMDARGQVINTITEKEATAGLNRIVWNMRYDGATPLAKQPARPSRWNTNAGPMAIPGDYSARVTIGETEMETTFQVLPDPRLPMLASDYVSQLETELELKDLLGDVHTVINQTDILSEQLASLRTKVERGMTEKGGVDDDSELNTVVDKIVETVAAVADFQDTLKRPLEGLNYRQWPRLRDEIRSLSRAIGSAAGRPTAGQMVRLGELKELTKAAQDRLDEMLDGPVEEINTMVAELPQVVVR